MTRWLVFAGLVALVIARAPVLLLEPRFWAEEGVLHYAYARSHDWLQSLLFVPLGGGPAGYFNLLPNLAALISTRCVSLEVAPAVFTLIALAAQLAPLAIVVWGRSRLWSTTPQRLVAGLLLVLAPCVVGDVWLNSINSQIFLGLATLLILCERLEGSSRRRRVAYRGLLAIGGLTGVYTAALAPAAVLRAYWQRGREARIHALLVAGSAALQASVYLMTAAVSGLDRNRFDIADKGRAIAFATYHGILRPLLGDDLGARLTAAIGLQEALGGPNLWRRLQYIPELPDAYALWAVALSLLVVAGLVALLGPPRQLGQKVLLAAMFSLWLVVVSATGPGLPRLRYATLPGLAVVLAVFLCARRGSGLRRWIARLLLALCLLAGVRDYRRELPPSAFGQVHNRPVWTREVARWRSQPQLPLITWPYTASGGWRLFLPPPGRATFPALDLIEGDAVQLVTNGPVVEHAFPLPGIPDDVKIVFDLDATRADVEVDFTMSLLNLRGSVLVEVPVRGFDAGRRQRVILRQQDLIPHGHRGKPLAARRLVVRLKSPLRSPVRVRVYRLTVSPGLESLLERISSTISRP